MLRKLVCSMVVMVVAIGFVSAAEYTATITKIDGGKVTLQKYKKAKKGEKAEKEGDEFTLPTAANAKVVYGEVKKGMATPGDAIEGGLKAELFTKAGDKGVVARITTEGEGKDEKVTQILIAKKKAK